MYINNSIYIYTSSNILSDYLTVKNHLSNWTCNDSLKEKFHWKNELKFSRNFNLKLLLLLSSIGELTKRFGIQESY